MKGSRITWRYWCWTASHEDLLTLSKEDLATFKLLVETMP